MNRRLTAKFRKHVIALPPGASFEFGDMDRWVEANTPKSAWQDHDPDEDYPYDPLGERCVECMALSKQLEVEGWLAYQVGCPRCDGDCYVRTDKTESEPWDCRPAGPRRRL
jgi:hypothetical protein